MKPEIDWTSPNLYTRNGRKVQRVLCTDLHIGQQPVWVVLGSEETSVVVNGYSLSGRYVNERVESEWDIIQRKIKKWRWVMQSKHSNAYFVTDRYYASAEEVKAEWGDHNYYVLQAVLATEIEE